VDAELTVKLAIYRHFAETGRRLTPVEVASRAGVPVSEVREIFSSQRAQGVLVLEADGESIRMAPPWSIRGAKSRSKRSSCARGFPVRPQPDEIHRIFTGLGFTGDFWDAQSDVFGRGT
jgi:hypothetical protein